MDREMWTRRLATEERLRGYDQGYKFLYCPWSTLGASGDAFISLNPGGKTPVGADLRTLSDERGNSYYVERATTESPITEQFLKFCDLVGTHYSKMLTGVAMPYRTTSWVKSRDERNLDIGRDFWLQVFKTFDVKRVFCVGKPAEIAITKIMNARRVREIPSGWGSYTIREYTAGNGVSVFGLLHFSTFKMLSNETCRRQLSDLIGI